MSLYMDSMYNDLIKYKFLRGANSELKGIEQKECYEEMYNVCIPDILLLM